MVPSGPTVPGPPPPHCSFPPHPHKATVLVQRTLHCPPWAFEVRNGAGLAACLRTAAHPLHRGPTEDWKFLPAGA